MSLLEEIKENTILIIVLTATTIAGCTGILSSAYIDYQKELTEREAIKAGLIQETRDGHSIWVKAPAITKAEKE